MVKKKMQKNRAGKDFPVPHFYWRRLAGRHLLTNDSGCHAWLEPRDFKKFAAGHISEKDAVFRELARGGFIRDRMDFEDLSAKLRGLNGHLGHGPGLHILVMTLRCNHKCVYCQSSAAGLGAKDTDMEFSTAKRCVDFAFQAPNPRITIEFQGGEPLLNWDVLRKTVDYARAKAADSGKDLQIALVSNFSALTEEKAAFLLEREVSLCTSLDGPKGIHNANRACGSCDSHAETVKWLKYFQKRHDKQAEAYRIFKPGALLTVTKRSLGRHREIIDEYVGLGLEGVHLRPLAPIGYAGKAWKNIGYTSAEFVDFYARSLDYIISLNRRGVAIRENMAADMLQKILGFKDPGQLDSRCPCGAAVGQLAYNYNGDVYTCDEGRMVGWSGDNIFRLGNVFSDSYSQTVSCAPAKVCVLASTLDSQASCSRCVYRPYCGVCPVYNYETQRTVWGNMPANGRCALYKGVFDIIFSRLRVSADAKILRGWVRK